MKMYLMSFGMAILLSLPSSVIAFPTISLNHNGTDARLVSGTTNSRDDNNGGNTITGALIGLNTGGIDNFLLYRFDDLPSAAGETVLSATVTLTVATGFANGNHGSALDVINLHALASTNAGWSSGTGAIGGGDNMTDDGSVSFLNRVQYNDDPGPASGTTEAWLDAGGNPVGNVLGALSSPIDSVPGYAQGAGPAQLTFNIPTAMAQDWVDNGLAGIGISTTDDGDSRSRFNFLQQGATLNLTVVPEPGTAMLAALSTLCLGLVQRRNRSVA